MIASVPADVLKGDDATATATPTCSVNNAVSPDGAGEMLLPGGGPADANA